MRLDSFQEKLLEMGEEIGVDVAPYIDSLSRSRAMEEKAIDALLVAIFQQNDFRKTAIIHLEAVARAENQRRTEREKLLKVLKS